MRARLAALSLLHFLVAVGCSVTPGDAARRGGHYIQAARLYEARATRGDALAAEKLGDLYYFQPGLPSDHQAAIHWYGRAVELGRVTPVWRLGTIYRDGAGNVPRDLALARKWFELGAEAGQHSSMYDLADLYARNEVQPADDVRALMWFFAVNMWASGPCLKNNQGCQYIARDPKGVRLRLESRMTPEQIAKARDDAREWVHTWEENHRR